MSEKDKVSLFAQRVYEAVRTIPAGKVSTYGDVASALGVRSPQAIGQALKRNPFAPEVPCHRVVAAGGTLGGFFGETSEARLAQKMAMLRAEGVVIEQGIIDMKKFRHVW